jgi:hypothetical protein
LGDASVRLQTRAVRPGLAREDCRARRYPSHKLRPFPPERPPGSFRPRPWRGLERRTAPEPLQRRRGVAVPRSGELETVGVNTRYLVGSRIVRQAWDLFKRDRDGMRGYRYCSHDVSQVSVAVVTNHVEDDQDSRRLHRLSSSRPLGAARQSR